MVCTIPVSGGKYTAIVDDEDYEFLMQRKWRLVSGYAAGNRRYKNELGESKRKTVHMHRVLNKTPEGMQTDHINGNKLDNRKCNLRSVTRQQNQMNKKVSKHSISGIKGVGWCKLTNKWRVTMVINKKYNTFGRFSCIKEATQKYNEVAALYHGEFARLNPIEGVL